MDISNSHHELRLIQTHRETGIGSATGPSEIEVQRVPDPGSTHEILEPMFRTPLNKQQTTVASPLESAVIEDRDPVQNKTAALPPQRRFYFSTAKNFLDRFSHFFQRIQKTKSTNPTDPRQTRVAHYPRSPARTAAARRVYLEERRRRSRATRRTVTQPESSSDPTEYSWNKSSQIIDFAISPNPF